MKRIFLILGISILTGIYNGDTSRVKKYYYYDTDSPKREITFMRYNQIRKSNGSSSKNIKQVRPFNTENSIIYGLTTFSILLILNSLFFDLIIEWIMKKLKK